MTERRAPRDKRAVSIAQWLRRHMAKAAIAGVLVVLLCVFAAYWLSWRAGHVSSDDARLDGQMIKIASRVDGWLTRRPVMEGDVIHQGQVLAALDKRDTRLRLDALQSTIAADAAQIQKLQSTRQTTKKTTRAQIDDATARVAAAKAAMSKARHAASLAESEYHRTDRLLKAHSVSRKQWDRARGRWLQRRDALTQARAQIQVRRSALADARAHRGQLDVLTHQIAVKRHQRKARVARADRLRQELRDRTLNAPVNGVVDKTMVNVGDYIQAGQWVMMVHDPKRVWVEANIKETEIGSIRVGQPVDITVDAYPNLALHGRVLRVGDAATSEFALLPSPNPSGSFTKITQRVPVRIALGGHDHRLKPGLMAEVSIDVAH